MTENILPPRAGSLAALGRNFLMLLGGRAAAAVFSLVYLAILTRTLGPERFGQFALIVGTAQAITAFVAFQSWQIVVRFGLENGDVADGDISGRETADDTAGRLVRLVKFCIALDIAGALAGCAIALFAVDLLAPTFRWDEELVRAALLLAFATLLSIRSTAAGILRLRDRFGLAANADAALTGARFVGALIVWASGPDLIAYLWVWGLSEFAAMAIYWILAAVSWRGSGWRRYPFAPRQALRETPGLLRFAAVTNIAQTVVLAGKQLPVLLAGAFVGAAAAGGFQVALQLGKALARVGQLAVQAILPEMVRSRSDLQGDFARLLIRMLRIAGLAGAIVVAIVLLFGKPVLGLVAGPEFLSSYPLLLVVATAAAIDLAAVPLEPALYAAGRELAALRVRIFVTICYVAGMIGLGAAYGAIGIAAAMMLAALMTVILMAATAKRALGRGRGNAA
ncbi:MAG: oligosaccharide flippase family protein [Pseudomonadota bacterium]